MRPAIATTLLVVLVSACSSEAPSSPPSPAAAGGWLVVTVRDKATRDPITDCHYYGMRFAEEEHLVGSGGHTEVDWFEEFHSGNGVYRWELKPGWHQLRLEADGHWRAWTPVFRIEAGQETKLDFEMSANILLRVKVFDADGSPLKEGRVGVHMNSLFGSMTIEDGVGELWVEDDEVTLEVGRVWLEDYEKQSIKVTLTPGEVNEASIQLKR